MNKSSGCYYERDEMKVLNYLQKHAFKNTVKKRVHAAEVPYDSIASFVSTMRQSSNREMSAFKWPTRSINFQWAYTVALHHMPPNCMTPLRSGAQLPEKFKEAMDSGLLRTFYHGTYAHALPSIMEQGFRTVEGAGSEGLKGYWLRRAERRPDGIYEFHDDRMDDVMFPGVYVAPNWAGSCF